MRKACTLFLLLIAALSHAASAGKFDFSADLIVWTARASGPDAWAEVIISEGGISSNTLPAVRFGWDPGFRVGVGYERECDPWDTKGYFTWFYTRGSDSVSSAPGTVHSTYLGNFYVDNPTGAGISGPTYQKANIDWTIRYNIFDWELGRLFSVSPWLTLRPFLGAKGGWIHQSIDTKWENPTLSAGSTYYPYGTEDLKNNFWGIGPQGGLDSRWYLFTNPNHRFGFCADFSGAIMWGHWSFADVFRNTLQQEVFIDFPSVNYGAPMIRSFMGLGWEAQFRQNRYRCSLQLGYETQFWLNQLQFYSFTAGSLSNVLTLQGGTLAFNFDY